MDFKFQQVISVFCLLFCLSTTSLFAQVEQVSIGVLEFESKNIPEEQTQKISRYIENAIQKTNRFKMVSRQLADKIEQERETQKENIDRSAIDQGKAIGADYIVTGNISRFQKAVDRERDRKGNTTNRVYTNTKVNYRIKILEVKTGIIIASDDYKGSLNGIDHHIRNFIRSEFSYDFTILEILKKKGNKKAKHILLDGGFKQGLQPGVFLEVFEVMNENVEGNILKREIKIGNLSLRRLDTSGNFSQCIITKGKKALLQKIESGAQLVCKIPKNLRFFGMEFEYEF